MDDIRACEVCGAGAFRPVLEQRDLLLDRREPVFRVVQCEWCGLLFTNPRPSEDEIGSYYPEEYYSHYHRDFSSTPAWVDGPSSWKGRVKGRLLERYYGHPPAAAAPRGPLERLLGGPLLGALHLYFRLSGRDPSLIPFVGEGKILDVGCGMGLALAAYRQRGWTPFGVEPSHAASRYAREVLGLAVRQGELLEAGFEAESFDVVLFRHSLEHVPSPSVELREAHRVLKPSGLLVVMVPNAAGWDARLFGRWWVAWDLPRHFYHFTPATLSALLGKTGFRVQRITYDPGPFTFFESAVYVSQYRYRMPAPPRRLLRLVFRPAAFVLALMGKSGVMTVFAGKA